jgi:hypothetical protein
VWRCVAPAVGAWTPRAPGAREGRVRVFLGGRAALLADSESPSPKKKSGLSFRRSASGCTRALPEVQQKLLLPSIMLYASLAASPWDTHMLAPGPSRTQFPIAWAVSYSRWKNTAATRTCLADSESPSQKQRERGVLHPQWDELLCFIR